MKGQAIRSELERELKFFVAGVRGDERDLVLGDEAEVQVAPPPERRPSWHAARADRMNTRRESLSAAIAVSIAWQRRLMCVPIALIVLLHVVAIGVFVFYVSEPRMVVALFAVTGLSLTLPVRWLMAIARELWQVELMAAAIPHASDRELAGILEAMLRSRRRAVGDRELSRGLA